MADLLKEIFYFQIIKPNNSFLISIMSDGVINIKWGLNTKKQITRKKQAGPSLQKRNCSLCGVRYSQAHANRLTV